MSAKNKTILPFKDTLFFVQNMKRTNRFLNWNGVHVLYNYAVLHYFNKEVNIRKWKFMT